MSIPSSNRAAENNIATARLYPPSANSSALSLVSTSTQSSRRNSIDVPASISHHFPTGTVKTLCNRGAAIVSVHLSEPVVFLTGFEPSEYTGRAPAVLRGRLILKLLKPAKIKAITLVFRGRARTEWPEGIPPRKVELYEEKYLMTHTWPFFNAQFASSESSHGADVAKLVDSQRLSLDLSRASMDSVSSQGLSDAESMPPNTPVASVNIIASNAGNGMLGIPFGQSQSLSIEDKTITQSRGYRIFSAGEYMYMHFKGNFIDSRYHFELPLDSVLPESIECERGSVKYELEASIERFGAFKSNLCGKTDVLLVRNPSDQNLQLYEPISVSRTWSPPLNPSTNV